MEPVRWGLAYAAFVSGVHFKRLFLERDIQTLTVAQITVLFGSFLHLFLCRYLTVDEDYNISLEF